MVDIGGDSGHRYARFLERVILYLLLAVASGTSAVNFFEHQDPVQAEAIDPVLLKTITKHLEETEPIRRDYELTRYRVGELEKSIPEIRDELRKLNEKLNLILQRRTP